MNASSSDAPVAERLYWLGFSLFPGIGPKKFHLLLDHFSSAQDAWNADETSLIEILGPALAKKFLDFRRRTELSKFLEVFEKNKTTYLTLNDPLYPQLLKRTYNPPTVLYVKGNFDFNTEEHALSVGIVGTRKITSYGRQVTEMITREIVDAGGIIISGLALGVDAVSHQTTLDNDGKTIAVLGCGIECCYPSSHRKLYDDIIASGGAVVSEFPFDQAPSKGSFPARNRIIAGLSLGIVVTEGAEDSGALITAKDAFTNNRSVFAIPGPITSSLSKGPNSLLSKGAKLVTSGQDILKELGMSFHKRRKLSQKSIKGETKEEQKIIDLLLNESLHFDEIVKEIGIESAKVGTVLSLMEMKGIIHNTQQGFTLVQ